MTVCGILGLLLALASFATARVARAKPVPPLRRGVAVNANPRPDPDTGKLTPRLYVLAHPAGQPGSVASQLPPSWTAPDNTPGGLQRLADGQVVVDIRLTDTSPPTLAKLAQAGATVLATSAELSTVTATVAPDHLVALEALTEVTSVQEDLAPSTNRSNS
jgi:hypothetical protein